MDPVTLDICWQRLIGVVKVEARRLFDAERRDGLRAYTDWMQTPAASQTLHETAIVGRRPRT